MYWFRDFFRASAAAAAVGTSDAGVDVVLEAEGNPCHQAGSTFWQRLWGGSRRAPSRHRSAARPSAMAHHLLRDIGMTPAVAQFKGLRLDWRP